MQQALVVFVTAVMWMGRAASAGTEATLKTSPIQGSMLIKTATTLAPGSAGSTSSAGAGYSQSGLYRLDLSGTLPESLTASIATGYSQEYSYVLPDGSSGGFIDTGLKMTKAWGEIRKNLTLKSSVALTLPTSKDSGRAGLKSAVTLSPSSLLLKYRRWDFTAAPAYTEFFHDIEVQYTGKPNIQRSLRFDSSVTYNFSEKLSTSIAGALLHGWNYRGGGRDNYELGYEVGYEISQKFSAALGLSTEASSVKSTGLESNYTFYDPKQTIGYLDIKLTL